MRPDEANAGSAAITRERGSGLISYQMHAEGSAKAPVGYVESSKGRFGVTAGSTPIPVHVWSHLTMTYDGAKLRYYVDGVLKGTATGTDPGASADQLLIGDDIHWAAEDAFKGLIDEVRVYDRALDEGEIAADEVTPIQTPARPPGRLLPVQRGRWHRRQGRRRRPRRQIEGAQWSDSGRSGKALLFDGENDCVKVPNSTALQLPEEFTIESWVKPQGTGGPNRS